MNHYIKSVPLAAVLALAMGSVSAQSPAPMGAASAPTKIGVSPQEAATATRNAVPRSDTATLVQTAPTAVDKARDVMNDAKPTPRTTTTTNRDPATTAAPMGATPATTTMPTTRRARADRN